jgi:hypothetical protein
MNRLEQGDYSDRSGVDALVAVADPENISNPPDIPGPLTAPV